MAYHYISIFGLYAVVLGTLLTVSHAQWTADNWTDGLNSRATFRQLPFPTTNQGPSTIFSSNTVNSQGTPVRFSGNNFSGNKISQQRGSSYRKRYGSRAKRETHKPQQFHTNIFYRSTESEYGKIRIKRQVPGFQTWDFHPSSLVRRRLVQALEQNNQNQGARNIGQKSSTDLSNKQSNTISKAAATPVVRGKRLQPENQTVTITTGLNKKPVDLNIHHPQTHYNALLKQNNMSLEPRIIGSSSRVSIETNRNNPTTKSQNRPTNNFRKQRRKTNTVVQTVGAHKKNKRNSAKTGKQPRPGPRYTSNVLHSQRNPQLQFDFTAAALASGEPGTVDQRNRNYGNKMLVTKSETTTETPVRHTMANQRTNVMNSNDVLLDIKALSDLIDRTTRRLLQGKDDIHTKTHAKMPTSESQYKQTSRPLHQNQMQQTSNAKNPSAEANNVIVQQDMQTSFDFPLQQQISNTKNMSTTFSKPAQAPTPMTKRKKKFQQRILNTHLDQKQKAKSLQDKKPAQIPTYLQQEQHMGKTGPIRESTSLHQNHQQMLNRRNKQANEPAPLQQNQHVLAYNHKQPAHATVSSQQKIHISPQKMLDVFNVFNQAKQLQSPLQQNQRQFQQLVLDALTQMSQDRAAVPKQQSREQRLGAESPALTGQNQPHSELQMLNTDNHQVQNIALKQQNQGKQQFQNKMSNNLTKLPQKSELLQQTPVHNEQQHMSVNLQSRPANIPLDQSQQQFHQQIMNADSQLTQTPTPLPLQNPQHETSRSSVRRQMPQQTGNSQLPSANYQTPLQQQNTAPISSSVRQQTPHQTGNSQLPSANYQTPLQLNTAPISSSVRQQTPHQTGNFQLPSANYQTPLQQNTEPISSSVHQSMAQQTGNSPLPSSNDQTPLQQNTAPIQQQSRLQNKQQSLSVNTQSGPANLRVDQRQQQFHQNMNTDNRLTKSTSPLQTQNILLSPDHIQARQQMPQQTGKAQSPYNQAPLQQQWPSIQELQQQSGREHMSNAHTNNANSQEPVPPTPQRFRFPMQNAHSNPKNLQQPGQQKSPPQSTLVRSEATPGGSPQKTPPVSSNQYPIPAKTGTRDHLAHLPRQQQNTRSKSIFNRPAGFKTHVQQERLTASSTTLNPPLFPHAQQQKFQQREKNAHSVLTQTSRFVKDRLQPNNPMMNYQIKHERVPTYQQQQSSQTILSTPPPEKLMLSFNPNDNQFHLHRNPRQKTTNHTTLGHNKLPPTRQPNKSFTGSQTVQGIPLPFDQHVLSGFEQAPFQHQVRQDKVTKERLVKKESLVPGSNRKQNEQTTTSTNSVQPTTVSIAGGRGKKPVFIQYDVSKPANTVLGNPLQPISLWNPSPDVPAGRPVVKNWRKPTGHNQRRPNVPESIPSGRRRDDKTGSFSSDTRAGGSVKGGHYVKNWFNPRHFNSSHADKVSSKQIYNTNKIIADTNKTVTRSGNNIIGQDHTVQESKNRNFARGNQNNMQNNQRKLLGGRSKQLSRKRGRSGRRPGHAGRPVGISRASKKNIHSTANQRHQNGQQKRLGRRRNRPAGRRPSKTNVRSTERPVKVSTTVMYPTTPQQFNLQTNPGFHGSGEPIFDHGIHTTIKPSFAEPANAGSTTINRDALNQPASNSSVFSASLDASLPPKTLNVSWNRNTQDTKQLNQSSTSDVKRNRTISIKKTVLHSQNATQAGHAHAPINFNVFLGIPNVTAKPQTMSSKTADVLRLLNALSFLRGGNLGPPTTILPPVKIVVQVEHEMIPGKLRCRCFPKSDGCPSELKEDLLMDMCDVKKSIPCCEDG